MRGTMKIKPKPDNGNGGRENLINLVEVVPVSDLRAHPRNYRNHPEDQMLHLEESLKTNGFYRNVVIAKDGTILAGHGVVKAAQKLGIKRIPVIRMQFGPDDPKALKILTGDNEISHLSEVDDRALTEMLKEIKNTDINGLLGTGYDEQMLANLAFVTRPQSEIKNFNEAAEWVGMPEYEQADLALKVVISFQNAEDRERFFQVLNLKHTDKTRATWWPEREREDLASVTFKDSEASD